MKKRWLSLAAVFFTASIVTACASSVTTPSADASTSMIAQQESASSSQVSEESTPAQRTSVKIAGLKGPTTMGVVHLMQQSQNQTARHDYQITMYGSPDEIIPALISGELDAAMIPTNLAAVLYQKTKGNVQVAAVNTLGVLSLIGMDETIKTMADLKGKTIYASGKGATPEYVLNFLLERSNLKVNEDVTVEYKSEATEVLNALLADPNGIAMLPQPYATTALMKNESLHTLLDLTQEWEKVSPDSQIITGVLVVRKEFANENPAFMKEFLKDYESSIQWVNENTKDAAMLIEQYGIVPKAAVAEKALPLSHLKFLSGKEMMKSVEGYLQVLYDANPASVGGALPQQDFYYGVS